MRLIDKDKFLRELIENPKYEDIGNLDDAIETVKYADEVDLSEHDKQIKRQTLNALISFANKHVFDEDKEIDAQITSAIKWAADEISKVELPQLSQSTPTIGEEKTPCGKTSLVKEVHDWPVDNKDPSKGHNYWFVNDANSKVHILVNDSFIDISFEAGALYKNYTFFASPYHLNNKEALTRIAENIFSADQNMSPQDWSNDYKSLFARVISDELCGISSMQIAEDVQANPDTCNNEHDEEEEEDGFDPGDDD